MSTYRIIVEECPDAKGRWSAICPEIGLFVEEATQEEAIQTAKALAPEMIEQAIQDNMTRKRRNARLEIVSPVYIPFHETHVR
jgi:predicted RNase H-like HicB family nuclease